MKSSIRIDVDFETNEPIIEIKCDRQSDILADKMLSFFLEKFGGDSSWAKFMFSSRSEMGNNIATLRPITRTTFPIEAEAMLEQHRLNVKNNISGTPMYPAKPESIRPRNRLDLMSPAERAITEAMHAVEETKGGSEALTKAVILLGEARDLVYDHIELHSK